MNGKIYRTTMSSCLNSQELSVNPERTSIYHEEKINNDAISIIILVKSIAELVT
jgi:hypothetical protein